MRTSCLVEIVRRTHTCIAVLGPAIFMTTYIICSHSYQVSMMQHRCQVYAGYVLCRALVIIISMKTMMHTVIWPCDCPLFVQLLAKIMLSCAKIASVLHTFLYVIKSTTVEMVVMNLAPFSIFIILVHLKCPLLQIQLANSLEE